jgi:molecular chaperone DnaK (HSP70)
MGQKLAGQKFAIDFGTTNSVVARWDEASRCAEVLSLPGLSALNLEGVPPIIPSLLYVHDGAAVDVTLGQAVRDRELDLQKNNRLFRNFKRGIVATPAPEPRLIDGKLWADRTAGEHFLRRLIDALPDRDEIDQLVMTVPVASFRGYVDWLNHVVGDAADKIRVVDESTAAALGYAVTEPGSLVLVFDFGGGTLDLSLVQLPENREHTGGLLSFFRRSSVASHAARVMAKAGRVIGGSDVDQWLLAEVLKQTHLTVEQLGHDYTALLTHCEQAKIDLSSRASTTFMFEAAGRTHMLMFTRDELEQMLEANGFYTAIRHAIDKVMYAARQQSVFKEDIKHLLLVGGMSLMPSVQNVLRRYFGDVHFLGGKQFTAVAEGALHVAAGSGLDDYLAHSYGLRYLDQETSRHQYDEIISMGSRYPSSKPIEVVLSAAHDQQAEMEFILGEIDTEAVSLVELKYEDGEEVFVAKADHTAQQIEPLNEAIVVPLNPPGQIGEERIKALFSIDDLRQLRLSIFDLKTRQELLNDQIIVTLR